MKAKIKYVASQSIKILLCLVISFSFLYIQPKQKMQDVDAALPLAAWAGAVLGNIILDTAVDMGIDFVDDVAKNAWKDKKVGEIWNKYGEKIKDLKPTKKNLTKWVFDAPKWLMAVIVDSIADEIEDVVKNDIDRKDKNSGEIQNKIDYDESDPMYLTGVGVTIIPVNDNASVLKGYAYLTTYGDFSLTPVAYGQKSELEICISNECDDFSLIGGRDYVVKVSGYNTTNGLSFVVANASSGATVATASVKYKKSISAFEKALSLLEQANKKVYQAGGLLVTDGYEGYFNLPDDDDDGNTLVYSPDVLEKLDQNKYPMIQEKEYEFNFGDDSGVIDVDYEVINEGDEVEWEIIEKDITNNIDNYDKLIDYDYEPTINNYYQLVNKEDLEKDISIILENDVNVDNGGNWSGEISIDGPFYCVDKTSRLPTACKTVEAIDGSLLDYVKNAYNYAVNAVKSGVDGLATVTTGAAGLIALYSHIFSWLPSEVTVILTSGLLLMVGLRVFRK